MKTSFPPRIPLPLSGSHKETHKIYHHQHDAKQGEGDKEHVHKNLIHRIADGRKLDWNPLFVGVGWVHSPTGCIILFSGWENGVENVHKTTNSIDIFIVLNIVMVI